MPLEAAASGAGAGASVEPGCPNAAGVVAVLNWTFVLKLMPLGLEAVAGTALLHACNSTSRGTFRSKLQHVQAASCSRRCANRRPCSRCTM